MFDNKPTDLRDVQPSSFSHIIGQRHVTESLKIAVDASFLEVKRLDDVFLCGPPGLGKSALVNVLAEELVVPFVEVLAQSIANAAELNAVLLGATDGILFLDEIHRLSPAQQHTLLQVLDKRRIFLSNGESVMSIPVAPFTLVGATTDPDGVIAPLIDRFRIVLQLDYYSLDELAQIVRRSCHAIDWKVEVDLPMEIARRGRQTPRIALRLLQSARRVAVVEGGDEITVAHLERSCELERISTAGLDNLQQKYLRSVGPSGQRLNVLSSVLGVSTKELTKKCEPFLLRSRMIVKANGCVRQLTELGRKHVATLQPESV